MILRRALPVLFLLALLTVAPSAMAAGAAPAAPAASADGGPAAGKPLAPKAGFTVAPLSLTDIRLAPGQSITGTLQVFTYGGGKNFEVTVGEASQSSDGAYILKRVGKDKNPLAVSNWLEATPSKFTSGPGNTEPVTWTVQVPKSAEPGDYVGVIYIKRLSDAQATSQRLNVEYAVRTEITVLGAVKFDPVIEQLNAPTFSNGKGFGANMRLTNRGNVRLDLDNANARLEFVVNGKVRKRFRLEGVVYPKVSRVWKFDWKQAPRFAKVQTRVVIDFPAQGKRSAQTIKRTASTWVFPYQIIVFAIALLGVLLMLLLALLSRRRKRRREAEVQPATAPLASPIPDHSADQPTRFVAPPEHPVIMDDDVDEARDSDS
jgi:hypothetical protein